MLHIRIITAPGLTGPLLHRLAELSAVQNLVVLEKAAVFRALRGAGLDHDGAITVEQWSASSTQRAIWRRLGTRRRTPS
jgi:hypothetical protein